MKLSDRQLELLQALVDGERLIVHVVLGRWIELRPSGKRIDGRTFNSVKKREWVKYVRHSRDWYEHHYDITPAGREALGDEC